MAIEDGTEPVVDEVADTSADDVADTTVDPAPDVDPAVVEPVVETPKTMDDTIRDRLRELNAPPDENAGKPGFVKDPKTGRFVKPPAVVAKPVAKGTDGKAADTSKPADGQPPVAVAKEDVAAKPADLTQAPSSWGAAARAEYAKLTSAVQAQVHKREADFHKGLADYKQHADVGREIMADFQPYLPQMRANNTTPKQLVQAWTNLEYKLFQSPTPEAKAKVMLEAAKAYGITAETFAKIATPVPTVDANGQPVAPPQVDPAVKALQDRLDQLTNHIEIDKTAQARIEFTKIEDEMKAFASANVHFEAVRHDMAALMKEGRANDLQDAYDKAIWANPEVRAILFEQQRVDEVNKAAERAAAARKAASANVAPRGTPPVKKPTPGSGTMDDTLRQAYRAIVARDAA